MNNLYTLYLSEVADAVAGCDGEVNNHFSGSDIAELPEPVRRYFISCGLIGKPREECTRVRWKDVEMRMSPTGQWMNLECFQVNVASKPARIVYMRTNVFGLIPFEARDKYQDGCGNMRIKFMKRFLVADAKGWEMDESGLVTFLSECLIAPACALEPYIKWQHVDRNTAAASISWNGRKTEGTFRFNDDGEWIRFETNDRWRTEKDGKYRKIRWSVTVFSYREENGVRLPARVSATWEEDGRGFEYFRGEIAGVGREP